MRRFGRPPATGERYRDRPGAYAVILSDGGDMLLAEQGGELLLPGGGIEAGESVIAALHREVWEETGWRMAPVRRVGVFQRYAWLHQERYWCRKIAHIHLCRAVRRLGPPVEPDHTPVWMRADLAVDRLEQRCERLFAARAIGMPEAMVERGGK